MTFLSFSFLFSFSDRFCDRLGSTFILVMSLFFACTVHDFWNQVRTYFLYIFYFIISGPPSREDSSAVFLMFPVPQLSQFPSTSSLEPHSVFSTSFRAMTATSKATFSKMWQLQEALCCRWLSPTPSLARRARRRRTKEKRLSRKVGRVYGESVLDETWFCKVVAIKHRRKELKKLFPFTASRGWLIGFVEHLGPYK